jgi:hypothetical protein
MENAVMAQDMPPDNEAIGHDTPLRAVRRHCLECCNGSHHEVRNCVATSCPLWIFRHGRRPGAEEKVAAGERQTYPIERNSTGTSALRGIRRRCLDCAGNRDPDVRACAFNDCALHPFRLGRNPFIPPRSAEWQQAAAERLAALKRPSLAESPRHNPMSARAPVSERELPPEQTPGRNAVSGLAPAALDDAPC